MNEMKKYFPIYITFCLVMIQSIVSQEIILALEFMFVSIYILRKKIYIRKKMVLIFFVLILHALINVLLGNNNIQFALKQIIGVGITYIFYDNYLRDYKSTDIMKIYIKIVNFLCVIAIIQELAYVLNIVPLYNYSWLVKDQQIGSIGIGLFRIVTIFSEPSCIATLFAPAVYMSINSLIYPEKNKISKINSVIIILVYLLTFSSLAYIGFGIAVLLNIINGKNLIKNMVLVLLGGLTIVFLYTNVVEFRERVDDVFKSLKVNEIENANLSSAVFVANVKIASMSTKDNFGLGTGWGSYALEHDKYIDSVYYMSYGRDLNREDGNSLVVRVLTELGVLGIITIIIFIIKFYTGTNKNKEYNIISNAILIAFILRLIRCGHYFQGEALLFVIIYIKVYKENNSLKIRKDRDINAITNSKL